ncbi:PREDICTED: chemokine-like factor [Gekko japonicus]|uniref:Chemokine-like factor n=1 Tax=Gekko japonicus TaxID=146911 RepID=A0ABM1L1B5_GEKJA|nr:PREDICTED: chemokine-like factor [Gekko japonicus]
MWDTHRLELQAKALFPVLAFMAFVSFAAVRGHEAFVTLGIMEFVITTLFFLLYLFGLQKKLHFFFWPLADVFNSLVAALFLIIVGLCATLIKTNTGTLVGGVFCLLLFVLCIADAVILLKMITFNKEARRNVTHK